MTLPERHRVQAAATVLAVLAGGIGAAPTSARRTS